MERNKIRVGITQGDINGVGYEVIFKTFSDPAMLELFEKLTRKIVGSGKAAGTLAVDPAVARRFLDWGATFVAVGVDTMLYTSALDAALAPFKK